MNPHHKHWLQKAQVQATAVGAFLVMWFLAWPLVRPWDAQAALTFVPGSDYASLAIFAGLVAALAALCAVATLPARSAGALLAVLVGVAAVGLRGGPMRALLMAHEADPAGVFRQLTFEMLLLGAVLAGSAVVIRAVRGLFRGIAPKWVWTEPDAEDLRGAPPSAQEHVNAEARRFVWGGVIGLLVGGAIRRLRPAKTRTVHALACLLMELAAAVILLVITFRSHDRGQIAFALAASFFLAALLAHQTFPVRSAVACWLGPLVMGVAVFAIGAISVDSTHPPVWSSAMVVATGLPLRAALPVDWLAMGGAGAVGGFWLSQRIHHARLHHHKKTEES